MSRSFLDGEGILIVVLAVLVLVLLAAGTFVLMNPSQDAAPGDGAADSVDTLPVQIERPPPVISDSTLEFSYAGEEGRTVLELLKRDHVVALDSELLLFGSIVIVIDSFAAAPNQYWIYYRDTTAGDRSPDVCTTFTGETIRWILRRRK